WNFGTTDILAELMQACVVLLRRAVFLRHLKTGEGDRLGLIGYVYKPQKGRRRRPRKTHDVFIGDQHDPATAQGKRHRQRRVGRPWKRGAPVEARDEFR